MCQTEIIIAKALSTLGLNFSYLKEHEKIIKTGLKPDDLKSDKLTATQWLIICHLLYMPIKLIDGYDEEKHKEEIVDLSKSEKIFLPMTPQLQRILNGL